MSPLFTRFAAALLVGAAVLHAEDAAPAKPEPVAPYTLKNKSKFTGATADSRAPFWPIGWVKKAVVAAPQAPVAPVVQVQLDEKLFKVTSILLGSGSTPSLAVINGRAYSEGEFLRIPKDSKMPPVRVRVTRINDGTVILQNADQTLVANLVRPELSSKKSEELMLDPDR